MEMSFKHSPYWMITPTHYHQVLHVEIFFFKSSRTETRTQMLEKLMGNTFWELGVVSYKRN